jgi:hypothetical protein
LNSLDGAKHCARLITLLEDRGAYARCWACDKETYKM